MYAEGKYRARAKTWGLGESGTGKEQVAVEFAFTAPEMAGQSITWYGYFTDGTFERTIESLRYCGWAGDDLGNLEGLDKNEVEIVLGHEEYEGQTYARVQWVNRAGGLAIKTPLQGDKAKSFAAQMQGRIRALAAAKGEKRAAPKPKTNGSTPPPGQPEPPPLTDDDMPF